MSRKRPTFWWFLAGPLVVLAALLLRAFPYLAITEPSGARVLVVEGWMDPVAMEQASQLVLDSGYAKVYTTGTVRPFAYLLGPGEGVEVELDQPYSGPLEVNVSGVDNAGFCLIAGGDTLLDQNVKERPHGYNASIGHAVRQLRVVAWSMPLDSGTAAIFVGDLNVAGKNVHQLQQVTHLLSPDGNSSPASPTYAQYARAQLIKLGVPAEQITAVPAYGAPNSRSWGNAHAFAKQARKDDLTAFDVATVGVHARRSRDLFQEACGPDVHIGVIALKDPCCTKANWWKSFRGWYTMMKEVMGAPEVQAVEATR